MSGQEQLDQQDQVASTEAQQDTSHSQVAVDEKKAEEGEVKDSVAVVQKEITKEEPLYLIQDSTVQKQEQNETATKNEKQDHFEENDTVAIDIRISDAVEKGSGLSKFTVYNIKGSDKLGEFDILRRYNEFHALRDVLLQRWPGIYIPPIPEKSIGQGSQGEVVSERTRLLNIFLTKISHLKYLYYSEEFQAIFIRSKDQDVAKQLNALPKMTSQDMIERYKKVFNLVEATEPSTEAITKVVQFQQFLKKIQTQLKQQLEQSKLIHASRKQLREQIGNSFATTFQTYEKDVMNDCVGSHKKLIFANPSAVEINEQLLILKEDTNNPLEKIYDLISTEQRDLEAFLQAIATREQMVAIKLKIDQKLKEEQEELQRLMQGKLPLKASLTKMSPEDMKVKLEQQIVESNKEAENQKTLYHLVSLILTFKQIDQYKKDKHQAYRQILNDMAVKEIELHTKNNQLWKAINDFAIKIQEDQS